MRGNDLSCTVVTKVASLLKTK